MKLSGYPPGVYMAILKRGGEIAGNSKFVLLK